MDRFRRLYLSAVSVAAAAALFAAPAGAEDKPAKPPEKAAEKPTPATAPKHAAEGILGKQVYAADGADMGLVTNVLVDRAGHPIAVVIDFGGFLGVGTRKIAVDWRLMQFHPGNRDKPVTLSLHKEQLKSAPTYNPDKPPRIVGAEPEPKKPEAAPKKPEAGPKTQETASPASPIPTPTPPTTSGPTATPAPSSKDTPGK
jgi:hypothetical protein